MPKAAAIGNIAAVTGLTTSEVVVALAELEGLGLVRQCVDGTWKGHWKRFCSPSVPMDRSDMAAVKPAKRAVKKRAIKKRDDFDTVHQAAHASIRLLLAERPPRGLVAVYLAVLTTTAGWTRLEDARTLKEIGDLQAGGRLVDDQRDMNKRTARSLRRLETIGCITYRPGNVFTYKMVGLPAVAVPNTNVLPVYGRALSMMMRDSIQGPLEEDVSGRGLRVLLAVLLVTFAAGRSQAEIKLAEIAELVGCDPARVGQDLKRLVAVGALWYRPGAGSRIGSVSITENEPTYAVSPPPTKILPIPFRTPTSTVSDTHLYHSVSPSVPFHPPTSRINEVNELSERPAASLEAGLTSAAKKFKVKNGATDGPASNIDERRLTIVERLRQLSAERLAEVAQSWPTDVAGFRNTPWTHTADECDSIEAVIARVESDSHTSEA